MSVEFLLPDVGEGVAEADVLRWLVNEGEEVTADQPVVEVQTDKAVVELPAPASGRVEQLRWKEGETVPVGEVLLVIVGGDTPAEPSLTKSADHSSWQENRLMSREPADKEWETVSTGRRRALAAPSTRRFARELGVDIHSIIGTGPQGRVMREDVKQFVQGESSQKDSHPSEEPRKVTASEEEVQEEPLSKTRRVIADRLLLSVTEKPHATHFDELDVTGLVAWRRKWKQGDNGPRIGYLPILLKIVARSLQQHPRFNAHFDNGRKTIRRYRSVHLGIAADTPRGLLVPVIREVDKKSIGEIAEKLGDLTRRAREGELRPDELKGSTFTISNAGSLGGKWATPIINPPEVGILALHPVEERPVIQDGELAKGWRMNVSLSFDHQVVDGADAIRLTQTVGTYTADPGKLLLELK
ncbi:dihydrolipoamide acetyltransferase family protein [Salinithrix halophila]|uniref:Dihydrolipoamide acetyltransferase component of pyruvate dehydrogenase complex n=1 Tax=Salinithrix halophila TaxID=1485204 RepID=A0ABV8JEM6_9BACL